jgi:hypothetical protein
LISNILPLSTGTYLTLAFTQPYPKLSALQHNITRMLERQSGTISDHAMALKSFVWLNIAAENFCVLVGRLESFNRIASQSCDDGSIGNPQPVSTSTWSEHEIRSVTQASEACNKMDILFHRLVEGTGACNASHTVMIQLSGYPKTELVFRTCTERFAWRRVTFEHIHDTR